MDPLTVLSAAEQVAAHLRREMERGALSGLMPGVNPLAETLGVNRKTVVAALSQLEDEGLLVGRGRGRQREVNPEKAASGAARMRVGILLHERQDRQLGYLVELRHRLSGAGHPVIVPDRSLMDLGMDPKRIERLISRNEADAWVVLAGSREVLEWFTRQSVPAFALFGRYHGLPMPGLKPDKARAVQAATQQLIKYGHRRIVMLVRRLRRLPEPGRAEQLFLETLGAAGIPAGPFNLPDWKEDVDSFMEALDSLFSRTPPTALIIDEAPLLVAVQQFLMGKGIRVPDDVSLVSTDEDPAFSWCKPSIAQIQWDTGAVIRRVSRWATNVSQGRLERRQTLSKAKFVEGGTIGPAKR